MFLDFVMYIKDGGKYGIYFSFLNVCLRDNKVGYITEVTVIPLLHVCYCSFLSVQILLLMSIHFFLYWLGEVNCTSNIRVHHSSLIISFLLTIVIRGKWLRNTAKFFVVCFCWLFTVGGYVC